MNHVHPSVHSRKNTTLTQLRLTMIVHDFVISGVVRVPVELATSYDIGRHCRHALLTRPKAIYDL